MSESNVAKPLTEIDWMTWEPSRGGESLQETPSISEESAVAEVVDSAPPSTAGKKPEPKPETHSAKPAKPLEPLGADLTPERFRERFERERVRLFQENAAALGVTPEEAERLAREQTLLFFEDIKHGRRITNRDYTLTADKSRWRVNR